MAASSCAVKQVLSPVNGIPSLISQIHPEKFALETCRQAVVVIPGNPGIIRFYDCFMKRLYEQCNGKLPIFGIQHAGIYLLYRL